MTTNSDLLTRTVDWVLDQDGDLYGDEQERLRWYEAIAVVASIQWIALPWLGVVALAVWGRAAAPPVALLLILGLWLPIGLANVYVTRKRVRTVPTHWSRKRLLVTVVSFLPVPILVAQFFWVYDAPRDAAIGGLVGAAVGGFLGLLARLLTGKRKQKQADADADTDEGDE